MADYTNSKAATGAVFPNNALESAWQRLEPLISPDQLVQRWLWGIPLVSAWQVPRQPQEKITETMLQDAIRRAVSTLEQETGTVLMATQFEERHPFDRQEFESFGYFNLRQKPVSSIERLSIRTPDGSDVFTVPLDWIETGHLARGRLYIIPLSPAIASSTFASLSGGSAYGLTMMQHLRGVSNNIPAYWSCKYTAGFTDGNLPVIANELVGIIAAQNILGLLGPTFARQSSHSLGIDGLSQSVSTPAGQIFAQRLKELDDARQKQLRQYKSIFGAKIRMGAL